MFSSPAVSVYNSENADNLIQRKPGNNVISRKPFLDMSVNSKSPDTGKLLKQKLNPLNQIKVGEKPKLSPKEDLNAEEYMFSFKEMEDVCEDIWPESQMLGSEGVIKFLRNYCNLQDTPPPSPDRSPLKIDPIFFNLPCFEQKCEPTEICYWNDSIEEVEIPQIDFDLDVF